MSRELNVEQIKKLWILDLILETGSLKKAALRAKVSPSAISQSVTSLELSLGRRLLVRERGSIHATSEAIAILEVVRPAFAAFAQLRDLQALRPPKMSWLNFGTYESIAIDILPALMESLRRQMPHLRLSLRVSRTHALLDMVRKGELCSALITEVDDINKFYVQDVCEDRLGLFVSSEHPLRDKGFAALAPSGLGSLAAGAGGMPRYFRKFMNQIETQKTSLLSDSFETLRAAAARGNLVAVLPARIAGRQADLIEVTPKSFREKGQHRISVVSLANCDPEETDFLAREAARHFTV